LTNIIVKWSQPHRIVNFTNDEVTLPETKYTQCTILWYFYYLLFKKTILTMNFVCV